MMPYSGPTAERQRYQILDSLRGLALAGIALANFPEFSLWTFLALSEQAAMPTAEADAVVRFWQYLLVDGKFYSIFSMLFGIGFSLILQRHGARLFVRRMLVLAAIGLAHLCFLWSGDILLLYALGGLLLPPLVRLSDKALLRLALCLLLLPVGLDALTEWAGIDFAQPFYDAWWRAAAEQGITEDNFAAWLRDADTYPQLSAFLVQGAYERIWEFVAGHRLPKVLALFLLGYLAGRRQLYARLSEWPLRRWLGCTSLVGVPLSLLYAWSAVKGHPWGLTVHSLLYATSVVPMALAYVAALCLLFRRHAEAAPLRWVAATGRMALSNYIGQSLTGIALFYGLGLGLGTTFGLVTTEATALLVFLLQTLFSVCWLRVFRFGLLEWLWRMLTYGRRFPLLRQKAQD